MSDMVFPGDDTPFAGDVAFTSGISLIIDTSSVYDSTAAASCFRRQVFDLAAAGLELSVSIESSSPERRHTAELEFVLELMAGAVQGAGTPAGDITVVMEARAIGPSAAWDLRCRHLGSGPLYIRSQQQAPCDASWNQMWDLRTTPSVRWLCTPFVLSPCRLLPAELAVGLLPRSFVQGPPGSAWVAVSVDVSEIADAHGEIDLPELDAAARAAVTAGERLHSNACWPTARLRHDAWLNRRLGIEIRGIGTLVHRRGHDPEQFAVLEDMSRLVRRIRDCAVAESQRIAAASGHVPALEQADLSGSLPGGRLRDGWSKRWRLAVEATALRHRNLLVMSPWSLFPTGETDPRYFNLLPLLRYADTCAVGEPPELDGWKFSDFKGFHQRAAAVLHQRGVAHQIAVPA